MATLKKVTVRLVDPLDSKELKKKNFQLVDNRLRVQQVQDYFQIKHIEWLEGDVILSVREDGLSDMEFVGGEVISLTTEEPISESVLNSSVSGSSDQDDPPSSQDDVEDALPLKKPRTATLPATLHPVPSAALSPHRRGHSSTFHSTHSPSIASPQPRAVLAPTPPKGPLITVLAPVPQSKTLAQQRSASSSPALPSSSSSSPATSPPKGGSVLSTSPPKGSPGLNSSSSSHPTSKMKAFNPHGRLKLEDTFNNRNSSVFIGPLKLPITPNDHGPKEFDFKLIIVGDVGCGKTSIIRRYVDGKFNKGYKATIGVDFTSKEFIISDKLNVRLQLWDVAGQERFGAFTRVYYQGATAGMVVFDLTRVKTSEAAAKWKEDIDFKVTQANGLPIPVVLVGNKSDLTSAIAPEHTPSYLDKLVEKHKFAAWFCTSCQEDKNIKEAFQYLGMSVLENDFKYPSLKEEEKSAIKLNMTQPSSRKEVSGESQSKSCCS